MGARSAVAPGENVKIQNRAGSFLFRIRRILVLFIFAIGVFAPLGHAQNLPAGQHWVATWAAAQLTSRGTPPPGMQPDGDLSNRTVRMIVRTSIGGNQVRVQFSNTFGTTPLVIGGAHIALRSKNSANMPNTDMALLFVGKPSLTIPPGAAIVSDTANLNVPPLADLSITVYVPGKVVQPTMHTQAFHTTYISKEGDFTSVPEMDVERASQSWYWISSVDVLALQSTRTIVALGDSITDGSHSTLDTNHSWPSMLAQRLVSNAPTAGIAVVNEGIGGNRILHDVVGPSALARFDRDVLAISGVKTLIVLEGINDIHVATRPTNPADPVSADDVIVGLGQIIERAHLHGIRVIGCTITPSEGNPNYSDRGNDMRETVNLWIRGGGAFDGVVDFEAAVRDPEHPRRLLPNYDSGDHLHPNDAGYKAMADAIDLSLFTQASRATAIPQTITSGNARN